MSSCWTCRQLGWVVQESNLHTFSVQALHPSSVLITFRTCSGITMSAFLMSSKTWGTLQNLSLLLMSSTRSMMSVILMGLSWDVFIYRCDNFNFCPFFSYLLSLLNTISEILFVKVLFNTE